MKIECIKKIVDINKIHYAIDKFACEHNGDKPSYIIMNYETRAYLVDNYCYYQIIFDIKKEDKLFNIPVAFNEGLKFGEVDII
jgi:hypothetical protein